MAISAKRSGPALAGQDPRAHDHRTPSKRTREPALRGADDHGLERFEWLVLAALGAVSCWVIAISLYYATTHGRIWTGIDGEFSVDQLQYLAWIRDASHHGLASDLFVLRPTPHDYLQPVFAISGGLVAVGVAPWLALLLWKPVAIAALFLAIRAWCRRLLEGRWERRAALMLALFGASYGVQGDEWLPFLSWGYPETLLAVAALVASLLAYERAWREGRGLLVAPALGLLASWFHPWQGELLIVIVVAVELALARRPRAGGVSRLVLPALTVGATALPLAYYAILGHADLAWRLGQGALKHSFPLSILLVPLIPLLVAAALAYLERPTGFLPAAARAWPLAALVLWALNQTGFGGAPQHAWGGITVPLAVLAVQGVQRTGLGPLPARRWLAALAVAALTIPATAYMLIDAPRFIRPSGESQNLIRSSEYQAFRYLASAPVAGGVLATPWLGDAVPGETGRRTYASDDWRWSQPDPAGRAAAARRLIYGRMPPPAARAFVLGTGVRFVLQNCRSRADLRRLLGPIVRSVHRFGCAAVYEVA